MGSNPSTLRKNLYLTRDEIEKSISKNSINIIQCYKKLKNSDGLLTTNELNIITYGLINAKTRKKIIQICGSKLDKLNFEDLCYFYSILNTSSFEAKLKFLLDFIFIKKNKLPKDKYVHKVKKYFKGSDFLQNIFLNQNIISNIISKEKPDLDNVYNYLRNNFAQDLNNYPLYKTPFDMSLNNDLEDDDNNSKNILLLKSRTSISKSGENHSNEKKKKTLLNSVNNANTNILLSSKLMNKYENLKSEFQDYEKTNIFLYSKKCSMK